MKRERILLIAMLLSASLAACQGRKFKAIESQLADSKSRAEELKSRGDALEARIQNLENMVSQQRDLPTRIVGKWVGLAIQTGPSGEFVEKAGLSITFKSDGTVDDAGIPGLYRPLKYRPIGSEIILFSSPGGRVQRATNVSLEGNRLSFLLDSSPPVAVILARQ